MCLRVLGPHLLVRCLEARGWDILFLKGWDTFLRLVLPLPNTGGLLVTQARLDLTILTC